MRVRACQKIVVEEEAQKSCTDLLATVVARVPDGLVQVLSPVAVSRLRLRLLGRADRGRGDGLASVLVASLAARDADARLGLEVVDLVLRARRDDGLAPLANELRTLRALARLGDLVVGLADRAGRDRLACSPDIDEAGLADALVGVVAPLHREGTASSQRAKQEGPASTPQKGPAHLLVRATVRLALAVDLDELVVALALASLAVVPRVDRALGLALVGLLVPAAACETGMRV